MIYFEAGSARELGGDIVAFNGTRDGERFHGFITREALEDLWAPAPPPVGGGWLNMFDPLEQQVFDLAAEKARRGRLEPDGSVVIRAEDRGLL